MDHIVTGEVASLWSDSGVDTCFRQQRTYYPCTSPTAELGQRLGQKSVCVCGQRSMCFARSIRSCSRPRVDHLHIQSHLWLSVLLDIRK